MSEALSPSQAAILVALSNEHGLDAAGLCAATDRCQTVISKALRVLTEKEWVDGTGWPRSYSLSLKGIGMLVEARQVKQPQPRGPYKPRRAQQTAMEIAQMQGHCSKAEQLIRGAW